MIKLILAVVAHAEHVRLPTSTKLKVLHSAKKNKKLSYRSRHVVDW